MRFIHILFGEPDGVQHGLRGALGDWLGDISGDLVESRVLLLEADRRSRQRSARAHAKGQRGTEFESLYSKSIDTHTGAVERDKLRSATGTKVRVWGSIVSVRTRYEAQRDKYNNTLRKNRQITGGREGVKTASSKRIKNRKAG